MNRENILKQVERYKYALERLPHRFDLAETQKENERKFLEEALQELYTALADINGEENG